MTLDELKTKYDSQFLFAQPHPSKLDVFCKTHGDRVHVTSFRDASGEWSTDRIVELERELLEHLNL